QATARLAARGPEFASGAALSPEALKEGAAIALRAIVHQGIDFAEWSTNMAKTLGKDLFEAVKPHLQSMWDEANRMFKEYSSIRDEQRRKAWVLRNIRSVREMTTRMAEGDTSPLRPPRVPIEYDPVMHKLEAVKNEVLHEYQSFLEREKFKNKGPVEKFWEHFIGVERAFKLSGPSVFGKLGVAAAVRELGLAPIESVGGTAIGKLFPKLVKGTRYGGTIRGAIKAEWAAKAAMFTKGMEEAA